MSLHIFQPEQDEPSVNAEALATQYAVDRVVESLQYLLVLPAEEQQRRLRAIATDCVYASLAIAKARP